MLPTVSIFTPTHCPVFLLDVFNSIKDQDFLEWVIVYNNGAQPIGLSRMDVRITEVISSIPESAENSTWIGTLKREATRKCVGDILLELDHDDQLMPTAVQEVREAFASDDNIGFVYSNAFYANAALTGSVKEPHGTTSGFVYRYHTIDGNEFTEIVAPELSPASVSRIWYAPDHLRAFRRSVYESVGGHNAGMRVLDDLDLMHKLYVVTKFHHIDKPLYMYRCNGFGAGGGAKNTTADSERSQEIQYGTLMLCDRNLPALAHHWAKMNKLDCVELGGRLNAAPGFKTVDIAEPADVISDLNEAWPFPDNSVGVLNAFDVFEHLSDPVHTWKELYRVLAPGGYAFIRVPSTDGRGAHADPTHKSFYNQLSVSYVTDASKNQYVVELAGIRFQAIINYTTPKNHEDVCWCVWHLVKLDDTTFVPGYVFI